MSQLKQLLSLKKHLEERYQKLVELSDSYRYTDENKSDSAAFKAMKILSKLNQLGYLNREFS